MEEESEAEAWAYSAERASASPSSSSDRVRVCGTVLGDDECVGVRCVGDEVSGEYANAERSEDWSGSSVGVWCGGVLTRAGLVRVRESMVTTASAGRRQTRRAGLGHRWWTRADDGRSIRERQSRSAACPSPTTSSPDRRGAAQATRLSPPSLI